MISSQHEDTLGLPSLSEAGQLDQLNQLAAPGLTLQDTAVFFF